MAKSTKSPQAGKSAGPPLSVTTARKPYPGFPLTPHPSGRWCKKIRGKLHYFGKVDAPEAALERFNREWPFLKDGRAVPPIDTGDGCTVRLMCNAFLTSKQAKLDSGELSPRSFNDYFRTCEILIGQLGRDRRVDDLRPDDFAGLRKTLAKTRGVVSIKNEVTRCRIVLKFAFDQRLIDRPVHFGQSFDVPTLKTLRISRHAAGPRLFTVDEITRILNAANPQIRAMVLLALNCGFGNSDVAGLPQSAIDLAGGWIDFPRPKTGVQRRIPLWRETIDAIKTAIAVRPEPCDAADADCVFLTNSRRRWVRIQERKNDREGAVRTIAIDSVSQQFARLLKSLSINGSRGFYVMRHVFETIAGESKDQIAVNGIMGHTDTSMAGVYRESISEARLKAVVNVVRAWVFGANGDAEPGQMPAARSAATIGHGELG